ncbi:1,3-beta-galactosyl-N-acetylhexosamine phosphorylase [Tuanshanicoccus lijuaniae]|uniref:1,3-beta-galactosyl-N-acetylhexosamine phosphorylase n=1 Tax=Aerococcaceae bacterium zg-1292 TaxID=2774330 RepID=UPI001BD8D9B1|nr:1,3-beta-galactosyl-N-acetylhexosamine phosphorylase [Aerococcaceae bacterium zg-A91]MBS4457355.1 1,3-beta-galactosyl-N-acetylhexosamine phosphorylase [Aerococcaceae bacterium zg-BR33]
MAKTKGRVTLPSETNFLEETKELMERWGADAIRDSDGTKLSDDVKDLDAKIYTTYFVARNHNDFIKDHMEECQQLYLMSKFNIATTDDALVIDFMDGYYREQLTPNYDANPKEWWEVINRTTGEIVPVEHWTVDTEADTVTIDSVKSFHEYTVSFLAYKIWDPTHMYNHTTNNWGDSVPHDIPFNVTGQHSNRFMSEYLEQWCQDNPKTDVVRFTTFFYHFTLVFNDLAKEKFVDWFGYGASISIEALEMFAEEKGYRLRPEHIVDEGYYNSTHRTPSKEYLDYIDFMSHYVAQQAKKLVDIVHRHGKEAMMFLGDNWIGTEPYGKYFKEIGLDAVVGSVGGGATLRMIADILHVKYTEGRFLPYFFPDVFKEGNDPTIEANKNWLTARRAMMRNPVDRIGYGGYLSLAYQFPRFVEYIEHVTDEFREIYDIVKGTKPYTGLKVALLNAWGRLRTWQSHMVAHELPYKQIYSYLGIMEALSGAAVEVEFISFDDIIQHGVPDDIDVLINAGDAGTAFSGGEVWKNPALVTAIRQFVYEGGGFIGVGEPSAYHHQGRYFQLGDILGVEREMGYSLSTDKYFTKQVSTHFITADVDDVHAIDFGESMKNVYGLNESMQVIEFSHPKAAVEAEGIVMPANAEGKEFGEIHLATNDYGKGRGVYIAGLPYSVENARLLLRALYYAANKEEAFKRWSSDNSYVEVHAYPERKKYAIVNNTNDKQEATIYDGDGKCVDVTLAPSEIRWEEM